MDDVDALMQSGVSLRLGVTDFIALTNQTLEYAYPSVEVIGEVQGFTVNQGKFVFFDLKDEQSTISCFMMAFQLGISLEDGMQVVVAAMPKLTAKGKFSLTVRTIKPVGEGSLRRSFELLKSKLEKEGLFDEIRKRSLPHLPQRIGVISSTEAAGFADFVSILQSRWGGLTLEVAHVSVQGGGSAKQIINALQYFNEMAEPPEVIAIIRGGGSLDDLMAFNDEHVVRMVASSRVPTLAGIGHETDISLVDLASDKRASTPSNAAQLLVPDRQDVIGQLEIQLQHLVRTIEKNHQSYVETTKRNLDTIEKQLIQKVDHVMTHHQLLLRHLVQLDPRSVLKRGYSIVRANGHVIDRLVKQGDTLDIETYKLSIRAGVIDVSQRKS